MLRPTEGSVHLEVDTCFSSSKVERDRLDVALCSQTERTVNPANSVATCQDPAAGSERVTSLSDTYSVCAAVVMYRGVCVPLR